jgi:hypothetical protein
MISDIGDVRPGTPARISEASYYPRTYFDMLTRGNSHITNEPLTEPDVVGTDPRRAPRAMKDKVTFPRASLQSRKVGFPDSGFALAFPEELFRDA